MERQRIWRFVCPHVCNILALNLFECRNYCPKMFFLYILRSHKITMLVANNISKQIWLEDRRVYEACALKTLSEKSYGTKSKNLFSFRGALYLSCRICCTWTSHYQFTSFTTVRGWHPMCELDLHCQVVLEVSVGWFRKWCWQGCFYLEGYSFKSRPGKGVWAISAVLCHCKMDRTGPICAKSWLCSVYNLKACEAIHHEFLVIWARWLPGSRSRAWNTGSDGCLQLWRYWTNGKHALSSMAMKRPTPGMKLKDLRSQCRGRNSWAAYFNSKFNIQADSLGGYNNNTCTMYYSGSQGSL